MARICAECRMPAAPVNECICDDEDALDMQDDNPAPDVLHHH